MKNNTTLKKILRTTLVFQRLMVHGSVAVCLSGLFHPEIRAAAVDYLPITLEQAANPSGPWTPVALGPSAVTTDGKLLLPAIREQDFWRLQVAEATHLGFSLGLPLLQAPRPAVKIAEEFLAAHTEREKAANDPTVGDPTGVVPTGFWRKARLGDTVIPVYEAAQDGGRTPAYLEFKVISDEPATESGPFQSTDGGWQREQGYILVSLTENDSPVADWWSDGETRVEKLRRRAGTAAIKPLMFGNALMVAEDALGNVRATDGTLFSRPGGSLTELGAFTGSGLVDTQTGESNRTPDLRLTLLQPYGSYAEMKKDYETNAFFEELRVRVRDDARLVWDIEKGVLPAEFRVQAGDALTILGGRAVHSAVLETPDDEATIARLSISRLGLRIEGVEQGSGVLRVQVDGREEVYTLFVTPKEGGFAAAGSFTPGWRLVKHYTAGTTDEQRLYWQNQSLEYGGGGPGNFVGCGPTAWTMLMGWWDLKGVPAVYRPFHKGSGLPNFLLGIPDAPKKNTYGVEDMMRDFRHSWVAPVLCNPFSGQCATLPNRMGDGMDYVGMLRSIYNAAYLPFVAHSILDYSYSYKWTYAPQVGVNDYNKLARASLRDGLPSIVGVGVLAHYALAYEYIESRYESAPGYFPYWRAWLKLNWGNGGVRAVKFTEPTFFATKAKLWQNQTNYVAP